MKTLSELRPYSLAALHRKLGGVPLDRIIMNPAPGTATEKDLARWSGPICELIDGVLVEKAMGTREDMLALYIARLMGNVVDAKDLGVVLGGQGYIKFHRGLIRAPDVTFIPWSSMPNGELPKEAYWAVTPGLIVEVLSPGNRRAEIDRKLAEFFTLGCPLAWIIDPKTQTARVYTAPKTYVEFDSTGILDANPVLPGFKLALAETFGSLNRRKKP